MLLASVASFCTSTRLPLSAPPALPLVAAQPVLAPLPLAAVESALGGLVDLSIAPPVAYRRRTLLRKRRQYFEEEVCLTDGPTLVSRCLAEAGGTAFIVLCIGLAGGDTVGSFVAGGAVGTAVAVFSKLSGAHYNPAITIALAAGELFPLRDVPAYIAAQYAGACLATASIIPPALPAVPCAFAAEATVTAILMYACLAIRDGIESGMVKKRTGPLLIGSLIAGLSLCFGPFSVGLNPAINSAPRLLAAIGGGHAAALAGASAYILGPCVGALVGGCAFAMGSGRGEGIYAGFAHLGRLLSPWYGECWTLIPEKAKVPCEAMPVATPVTVPMRGVVVLTKTVPNRGKMMPTRKVRLYVGKEPVRQSRQRASVRASGGATGDVTW